MNSITIQNRFSDVSSLVATSLSTVLICCNGIKKGSKFSGISPWPNRSEMTNLISEMDASPVLEQTRPHHTNVYSSPPSMMPTHSLTNTSPDNNARTTSGPISITSLVNHPHQHTHFSTSEAPIAYPVYMNYGPTVDFYGSDGSHSPVSDHFQHPRQSISSSSSVAGFDYASISPTMTTSIPGYAMTAAVPPPIVLPSTFDEGQTAYMPVSCNTNSNLAPLLRLISHQQSIPCIHYDLNVTASNLQRYSESYPLYPNLYSNQLDLSYQDIYDQIV